jgi:hypothetical protein
MGNDIYKFVDKKENLTYGKLHNIFHLQPTTKAFLSKDELILRRIWDGHVSLVDQKFLKNIIPTDPYTIRTLQDQMAMDGWFKNIYGDLGNVEKYLYRVMGVEIYFDRG